MPRPAPPRPAVAASLPPSTGAGIGTRGDHPSGNTQDGDVRTPSAHVGQSLPVSVGQIKRDPHGTDVHVVVVNVLRHEVDDVRISCKASDAQGMQVAEATSSIAMIAPSDVGLAQVLFPSEITTQDNTFTCDSGTMDDAKDVLP